MKIKITDIGGFIKEINGDILYHNSYIIINYYNDNNICEFVMPWHRISEIETHE